MKQISQSVVNWIAWILAGICIWSAIAFACTIFGQPVSRATFSNIPPPLPNHTNEPTNDIYAFKSAGFGSLLQGVSATCKRSVTNGECGVLQSTRVYFVGQPVTGDPEYLVHIQNELVTNWVTLKTEGGSNYQAGLVSSNYFATFIFRDRITNRIMLASNVVVMSNAPMRVIKKGDGL